MLSEKEIKEILKKIEADNPDLALPLLNYITSLEEDLNKMISDDAYRGFIIKAFSDLGGAYDLMKRIDSSILSLLADEAASKARMEAELAKQERIRLETQKLQINNKKDMFSQPVLLAIVAILSTAVTQLLNWGLS